MPKIEPNEIITLTMHSPREKVLGVLHEVSLSGVFLRGIELNYFDEWTTAVKNEEPYLPMQDYFFPMWRIERLIRDERNGELLSMAEQFEQRTGLDLRDF